VLETLSGEPSLLHVVLRLCALRAQKPVLTLLTVLTVNIVIALLLGLFFKNRMAGRQLIISSV
jgi:hypothetical protein